MVPTTAPTDDSSSSEEDELFPSLAGFGDAGSGHETDSDTDGTLIDAGGGVGDGGGLVVRSVNGDSGNSEGEEKGQTTLQNTREL